MSGTLPAYPVWTVRPDWNSGIIERLQWKTDILTSSSGAEQRRRVRNTPRMQMELPLVLLGRQRRAVDAMLTGPGGAQPWHMPLWWDSFRLEVPVKAGDNFLPMDALYGEFVPGGSLIVLGNDPFSYEWASIYSVTAEGITLSEPLANDWAAHSPVHPTRLMRLMDKASYKRRTDDAGDGMTLLFQTCGPNEFRNVVSVTGTRNFTTGNLMDAGWQPTFPLQDSGLPVWTAKPDYAQDMTYEYQRTLAIMDNDSGSLAMRDVAQQAFTVQQMAFFVRGRQAHNRFRGWLYYMEGKRNSLWMPTFMNDLALQPGYAYGPQDAYVNVLRSGFGDYDAAAAPGRGTLAIALADGSTIIRDIVSVNALGNGVENITFEGKGVLGGQPVKVTFLQRMRQDQDDIDILHQTDTTGVSTLTTTFRAIESTRVATSYNLAYYNGKVVRDADPAGLPAEVPSNARPVTVSNNLTPTTVQTGATPTNIQVNAG